MITSRVMSVPSSGHPRRVANPSRSPRQADFADPLMVPVVALAWKAEARQPAARVRLNAIAASTSLGAPAVSQACLAPHEGRWPARTPSEGVETHDHRSVSYTHLTLPTIYSV